MAIILLFSISIDPCTAQNVAINNDGSPPNTNAILDVKSTNKGILIPRIDFNNRPTTSVDPGLLIFVTSNGPLGNNAYYYYDGFKWLRERNSDDVQTLSLSGDSLSISGGNTVVVGNILNLIGYYKCNSVYTRIAYDINNCGACGNVCNFAHANPYCQNGVCSYYCLTGYGDCDNMAANGCETNLTNNLSNCGTCGHVCLPLPNSTVACVSSACGIGSCNAGYANCDNMTANGCEVNITNNLNNCGGCGVVCPGYPNANASCVSSACSMGTCNAGYANCDNMTANGCEVNLTSNDANCGSCGHICPGIQHCVASVCQ